MPRNYHLKELIPELLVDECDLTMGEIKDRILEKKDDIFNIRDKTLNENLLQLLKTGKIGISGYKFKGGREQNIKSELLTFDLVHKGPFEIYALLKNLEDIEPNKVKKSHEKLKRLFLGVYSVFEDFEIKKWEYNLKSVKIIDTDEAESLLKEINVFLKGYDENYGFLPNNSFFVPPYIPEFSNAEIERLKLLVNLLNSIEGIKRIWFYLPPKINFESNEVSLREYSIKTLIKKSIFNTDTKVYRNNRIVDITGRVNEELIDEDGRLTQSGILNKLSMPNPSRFGVNGEYLFDWIIQFIFNLDEKEKDYYLKRLASGLSDSYNSWFHFDLLMKDLYSNYEEQEDVIFDQMLEGDTSDII